MELLKLMGLCVVCLVPVLLLKRKTPELALLLTLAILCAAAVRCVTLAAPVLKALEELFRRDGVELGNYDDCGLMLYHLEQQDVHCGGSGCGTGDYSQSE